MDQTLLDVLACPVCKTKVQLEGERLLCTQCGRRYPIRDGIPDHFSSRHLNRFNRCASLPFAHCRLTHTGHGQGGGMFREVYQYEYTH